MTDDHEGLKNALDGAASIITVAAVFQWLPAISAFLSVVWLSIRIFEWAEGRWGKKREG